MEPTKTPNQNQNPNNQTPNQQPSGPADEAKTVDELKAELEAQRTEVIKWKNASNKASSEAANYKKQLQAKLSVDEQAEQAKREREDYYKGIERENSVMKQSNLLIANGFSQDEAQKIAEARYDGDLETALTLENKHYSDVRAALKKEYDDKVAKLTGPQSGNGNGVDYTKQFNDAMKEGDRLGAIGAILHGSNFIS